jgi:manganese/zinc/iron transport system permease protein
VCTACFVLALLLSPRHGLLTRRWRRARAGAPLAG